MNQEQLVKFRVVVWNNTSGDTLTEDQRAAFKSWMENGGSFVGTHGSGGDPVFSGPGPHFGGGLEVVCGYFDRSSICRSLIHTAG